MNNYTINKTIQVCSPPERVYEALTNSEEIVKYFPLNEVISDWTVGGEVLYKGEVNGQGFVDHGVIEVLSRPSMYKYSYWSTNHGTERTPENHLSITYELLKNEVGTEIKLEQSNIRSEEMYKIMESVVWDSLLNELKAYVERST